MSGEKDYREELKDLFEALRAKRASASYGQFARKLGISRTYLTMVFSKRRHLSIDMVRPLAQYLKLSKFQEQVMTLRVLKANCRSPVIDEMVQNNLDALRWVQIKDFPQFAEEDSQIHAPRRENWVTFVIGALARIANFRPDGDWMYQALGKPTGYTPADILKIWEDYKASRGDSKEFVYVLAPKLSVPQSSPTWLMGLEKAVEAAKNIPDHRPLHYSVATYAFDKESHARAVEAYATFRNEVARAALETKAATQVSLIVTSFLTVANEDHAKVS